MSGYRVFTQDGGEIHDGLICCYCKLLLREPVQTTWTGLRFCRECFDKAQRDPEFSVELDSNDEVWPDFAVRREIANLKVKCDNYQAGCDWAGLFKELMKHMEECQFIAVVCKNPGCGEQVLLSELEKHLKEKCLYRQVQCKDCGKKMPFIQLQEHTELCPNVSKVCKNCNKRIPASQYVHHINNECKVVRCVCKEEDAVYEVGSDKLKLHLQDTSKLADHLVPMITEFSKMSLAFQKMTAAYQLSTNEIEELKKKVKELEIRNKVLEKNAQQSNENRSGEYEKEFDAVTEKYGELISLQMETNAELQNRVNALELQVVNSNADNSMLKDSLMGAVSQLRENSTQLPDETESQLHKVVVNCEAIIQNNKILKHLLTEKLVQLERDLHCKKTASDEASEKSSVSSDSCYMEGEALFQVPQDSPKIYTQWSPSKVTAFQQQAKEDVVSTNTTITKVYSQIMEHIESIQQQQQQTVDIIAAQQQQIQETTKTSGDKKCTQILEQLKNLQQQQQNVAIEQKYDEVVPYEKPPSFKCVKQLEDKVLEVEDKVLEVERTLNVLSVHHSELELQLQASLASTHNGAFLWRIPEVRRRMRDAKIGRITSIYSPPFYTGRNGYKMCIRAYLNGDGTGERTHLSIFFVLMRGENDPLLQWPFEPKVSLILVDQDHKKHLVQTFKPNAQSSSFKRPVNDMNVATGCPEFAELSILDNPSYVKGDVMYIKAIVDTSKIFHP